MLLLLLLFVLNLESFRAIVATTISIDSRPHQALYNLETLNVSFHGEGMAYYAKKNCFVFGSLTDGTLLTVPHANRTITGSPRYNGPVYNLEDFSFILNQRPKVFNGSNFLGLEMDPVVSDVVWGCVASLDHSVAATTSGIVKINMETATLTFYDFTALANPDMNYNAVLNDLTFDDSGHIFITDTYGYRILRFDILTETAIVWNNGTSLCSQCLTSEPHFDGPNGITFVPAVGAVSEYDPPHSESSFLLVSLGGSSGKVMKVSAVELQAVPQEVVVSGGSITGLDALSLKSPSSHSDIYIVGNGEDALYELHSDDNWYTSTLLAVHKTNCPEQQPSAVTVLPHGGDAVVYCTNGFGDAPYPLNILKRN